MKGNQYYLGLPRTQKITIPEDTAYFVACPLAAVSSCVYRTVKMFQFGKAKMIPSIIVGKDIPS